MGIFSLLVCIALLEMSGASPMSRRRKRLPYSAARSPKFVLKNSDGHPIIEHVPENCRAQRKMSLHKFKGKGAPKCLDGSQSTFYLLRRRESKDWVIHLPGGLFCASSRSCNYNLFQKNELVTSKYLDNCRPGEKVERFTAIYISRV